MKIIDIYNKIAKGEELPKKIKYKKEIYVYYGAQIGYSIEGQTTCSWNNLTTYITPKTINDEVEVLEEENKTLEKDKEIIRLKQENERLNKGLDYAKRIEKDYKEKFDKAIKYIDDLISVNIQINGEDKIIKCYNKPLYDLLNILQGGK